MTHRRFDSRGMLAPRDDDYIRARQRRPRLPQTSRWKQMAAPKGICGIDQHNIHIARKLPVLKAIVKNEPLYSSLSKLPAEIEAVSANSETRHFRAIALSIIGPHRSSFLEGSRTLVSCGLLAGLPR